MALPLLPGSDYSSYYTKTTQRLLNNLAKLLLPATMKSLLAPHYLLGLFLLSIVFISSCGDDNALQETDLLGRWEISEAARDGKVTDTMEGMYFSFAEGGQLTTNMTGADETYRFELDGDQIEQREGTIETDYTIESLIEKELILTTTLRGKHFRMVLQQTAN